MADNLHETSPWHSSRWHQALVPIGNGTSISVTLSGQPRLEPCSGNRKPLVIIEAGLGGTAAEHIVVAQLIAPFARVLRYDRGGYAASTRDLADQTPLPASTRAHQLTALLEALNLPPPYVLAGQSYGGILIREFLRQRPGDVAGMVFVDSPVAPDVADMHELEELIAELCGERSNYEVVNGLHANLVLTPEQFEAQQRDELVAEQNGTCALEAAALVETRAVLAEAEGMTTERDANGRNIEIAFGKQPLGHGRLSVICGDVPRDFEAAIKYGKAHGYGTEETYAKATTLLQRLDSKWKKFQAAQVQLTNGETKVRIATGTGRTHNLHITRPDIVAEEIRWVLAGCSGMQDREDLLQHE